MLRSLSGRMELISGLNYAQYYSAVYKMLCGNQPLPKNHLLQKKGVEALLVLRYYPLKGRLSLFGDAAVSLLTQEVRTWSYYGEEPSDWEMAAQVRGSIGLDYILSDRVRLSVAPGVRCTPYASPAITATAGIIYHLGPRLK